MYNIAQGVYYSGVQSVSSPASGGTAYNMVQAADLVRTNNTFTNSDLTVPIAANQTATGYVFARIALDGNISGSKYLINCPAGASYYFVRYEFWDDLTPAMEFFNSQTVAIPYAPSVLTSGSTYAFSCYFTLKTGATSGAVTLQFGQLITDADAATFFKGAFMNVIVN